MATKRTTKAATGVKVVSLTGTTQLTVPQKPEEVAIERSLSISGQAALIKVTDDASSNKAMDLLSQIAAVKKEVTSARDFVIKPLKVHIAQLETLFRPARDALETADATLRRKVLDYRAQAALAAQAEQSRLMQIAEAAAAKGQTKKAEAAATAAIEVSAPARMTQTSTGQVSTQKPWTFEVEDAGAVPNEYWTLDDSKIRAAVRAGLRSIPGVRIYQEERLVVGGR